MQNGAGTVGTVDIATIVVTCTKSPSTYAYAAVVHSSADPKGLLEYFTYDPVTGRLSLQGTLPAPANTYVDYVKAVPSSRQLLVSTRTLIDRVSMTERYDLTLYDLSPATGAPAPSMQVASPGGGDLVVHPNGVDLYVPGSTTYHYSLARGAAQGQSLAIGVQPSLSSAIAPDGKFLFIPNTGQNGTAPSVAVVSLADPLRPQLLLKAPTPIRPLTATISPDGKLLYVTPVDAKDSGYIFKVDTSGGLTQSGVFAAPSFARSAVIVPSGKFLYLASGDGNLVQGYRLDGAGGVVPTGAGTAVPSAFRLVLSPDAKYLYALSVPANGSLGAIHGFAIGADGVLTPVPGSPFSTGEREYDLAFAVANP